MPQIGWTAAGADWLWICDYRGFRLTVTHDSALDEWECTAANACSTITTRQRGDGLAAAREAMRLADQLAAASQSETTDRHSALHLAR